MSPRIPSPTRRGFRMLSTRSRARRADLCEAAVLPRPHELEPRHCPPAGRKHWLLDSLSRRERHNVAVSWVRHRFELLDREMQESHHETPNRQAMRHDEHSFGADAKHLTHHALEKP